MGHQSAETGFFQVQIAPKGSEPNFNGWAPVSLGWPPGGDDVLQSCGTGWNGTSFAR